MSLRISSGVFGLILLAACGGEQSPAPEGEQIECAIGPGAEFASVCTLERIGSGELVVHHPDGGIRRFAEQDGAISVIDGADEAELKLSISHAFNEYSVGQDRYRFPNASDPRLQE